MKVLRFLLQKCRSATTRGLDLRRFPAAGKFLGMGPSSSLLPRNTVILTGHKEAHAEIGMTGGT
jgi:hypothetical protein